MLEDRLSLGRRHRDERQRYLAGLESLAERLRADERRLRAEVQLAVADGLSPEAGAGRAPFSGKPAGELARGLIERHGRLARSVVAIESQIAEVGAALGAAEQEQKGHELAAAHRTASAGLSERRRSSGSSRIRQAAPPVADPVNSDTPAKRLQ